MTTMSKTSTLSDAMRSDGEFALARSNSQALAKAAEAWFAASAECQREMLGCRNLADVAAIQSRWLEETLRDYNSEMTKLMGIYTKSANGGSRTGGCTPHV